MLIICIHGIQRFQWWAWCTYTVHTHGCLCWIKKKATNKQIFSKTFLVFSRTQSIQSMSKRAQLVHCKMYSLLYSNRKVSPGGETSAYPWNSEYSTPYECPMERGVHLQSKVCGKEFQRSLSIKELRPGQRVSTLGNSRLWHHSCRPQTKAAKVLQWHRRNPITFPPLPSSTPPAKSASW